MTQPNPYQSPESPASRARPLAKKPSRWNTVGVSIFMILAGLFFCVASFYALFAPGIEAFWTMYRSSDRFSVWFPVWFLIFYGFVSGLTSLLHLSYLARGWPKQGLAGVYAIGAAAGLTGITAAVLEFLARG